MVAFTFVLNNPLRWVDPLGLSPNAPSGFVDLEDALNATGARANWNWDGTSLGMDVTQGSRTETLSMESISISVDLRVLVDANEIAWLLNALGSDASSSSEISYNNSSENIANIFRAVIHATNILNDIIRFQEIQNYNIFYNARIIIEGTNTIIQNQHTRDIVISPLTRPNPASILTTIFSPYLQLLRYINIPFTGAVTICSNRYTGVSSLPYNPDTGMLDIGTIHSTLTTPIIWPTAVENRRITSGFGNRFHPIREIWQFHGGIDIADAFDTPIFAATSGVVLRSGYIGAWGEFIEILSPDGIITRYAHLNYGQRFVFYGDTVHQGQLIGLMGSTGLSTGSHLHFEILINGIQVDPLTHLPR